MMRGLWTAASGMQSQQTNLDVIANNLSNVNTTGYKRTRAEFQDLVYQTMMAAGSTTGDAARVPSGIQIGLGSRTAATQKVFTPGDMKQTDNPLDLAILGDGFFAVMTPDGTPAYTRDGAFKLDDQGRLVNADGYALEPAITIPQNTESITIGPDGTVTAKVAGQTTPVDAGQLQLIRFVNPAGLSSIGHNLYVPTASSGNAVTGEAGSEGFGRIAQNTLELSNVRVVEEMVAMIVAQRAYETNSKAIQAADEMLQLANQIRR
ncbi:MAG TPA: flagellar basal-body rod protein FlgG [Armatimonadota bacterium]|nr:flagellar basal-body rod protein FlgG [Armatimonadota bacterium]